MKKGFNRTTLWLSLWAAFLATKGLACEQHTQDNPQQITPPQITWIATTKEGEAGALYEKRLNQVIGNRDLRRQVFSDVLFFFQDLAPLRLVCKAFQQMTDEELGFLQAKADRLFLAHLFIKKGLEAKSPMGHNMFKYPWYRYIMTGSSRWSTPQAGRLYAQLEKTFGPQERAEGDNLHSTPNKYLRDFYEHLRNLPLKDHAVFIHKVATELRLHPNSDLNWVFRNLSAYYNSQALDPKRDPMKYTCKDGAPYTQLVLVKLDFSSACWERPDNLDFVELNTSVYPMSLNLQLYSTCNPTISEPKFYVPAYQGLIGLKLKGNYVYDATQEGAYCRTKRDRASYKPILWQSLMGYQFLAGTSLDKLTLDSVNFTNTDLPHLQALPLQQLKLRWVPLDINAVRPQDLPTSLKRLSCAGLPIRTTVPLVAFVNRGINLEIDPRDFAPGVDPAPLQKLGPDAVTLTALG